MQGKIGLEIHNILTRNDLEINLMCFSTENEREAGRQLKEEMKKKVEFLNVAIQVRNIV